ncbi:hypothetical protein TYRP_012309 [Tyrophagus putrescentiae]|nr:hypothetical protein TYRP_012309 [Tyrophagus putrescentiae]
MGRYFSLPVFDASYEVQSAIRRRRPSPTSRPAFRLKTSMRLGHHDAGPASTPLTWSSACSTAVWYSGLLICGVRYLQVFQALYDYHDH